MKKIIKSLIQYSVLAVFLIGLSGCGTSNNSTPEHKAFKLLDVNDPTIFEDAHIAGAINLSYSTLEKDTLSWDKDSPIVVYCSTYECTESGRVARKLKNLGFTHVQVYKGGTQEWYQLGQQNNQAYPYEGPAEQRYLKRQINKIESKDGQAQIITAQDLSKRLAEAKK